MQHPVVKTPSSQYNIDYAIETIAAIGNIDILKRKKLALFCSIKCPGNIILKAYDLALALRDAGLTLISGFHSPMEREVLTVLFRADISAVICPARSIEAMRLPKEYIKPLEENRLLILSPFDKNMRRPTTRTSGIRNEFVATIADMIFVAHAAPYSKTEAFSRGLLEAGKKIYTLDSDDNTNIISLGAVPLKPSDVKKMCLDQEMQSRSLND